MDSSLVRRGHGRITKTKCETNGNQDQVLHKATKQQQHLPTYRQKRVFRNHASGIYYGRYILEVLRLRARKATRWNVVMMAVGGCLLFSCFYQKQTLASTQKRKRPYPRSMACYFDAQSGQIRRYKRLETYAEYYQSFRTIIPQHDLSTQKQIEKSKHYRKNQELSLTTDKDCIPQHHWQTTSFPSCNIIHEIDVSNNHDVQHLSKGYWRNVWTFHHPSTNTTHILKTLRYNHGFTQRNYERHRWDAVASEHLTPLPNVVDIYAYCGQSALFEYSPEGDLKKRIWPDGHGSRLDKLQTFGIACQVAEAIADSHTFDNGIPSIAHTDISPSQFISINGVYKLNDFNRCRFLMRKIHSSDNSTLCTYRVEHNPGKLRSPEEYQYLEQDEKVDVYSMGHIFYMLLTHLFPYVDIDEEEVQQKVINDQKPFLHYSVTNSTHPVDVALLHAMQMCYVYERKKRASATDVLNYLKSKRVEIEKYYGIHRRSISVVF